MSIQEVIRLSELLAEMAEIKRGTKLPSGEFEPDSHHSFSLALIAYHICTSENIQVDIHKVVLFALVHDLLEIITGDEDTLHATEADLHAKHQREESALQEFDGMFSAYPELKQAMYEYEKLDTPEAAAVYVPDKACTTWTHHADKAAYANDRGITIGSQVDAWAERQHNRFTTKLNAEPPREIMDVFDASFKALRGLYEH